MSTEEKKDIEYNEEQKKIIEEIEGHVNKIKEINDITIGENEKLVDIKERLVPIPERIRNLRNELLKQLDQLKEKLKQLQDEAANDKTLENIVNLIKTSIEKIDDLSKETATLNTNKDEINDAIDKKLDEAINKELPDADQKTKDIAKKIDQAEQQNQPAIINESLEDSKLEDIFKSESGEFKEITNRVSRPFEKNPVLYKRFKKELVDEYKDMENKGKLTKKDIDKLVNQSANIAKKSVNIHKSTRRKKKSQDPNNSKAGGKRTRKRRNSRKKKVVKRR